eukprot:1154513-Pelagomonas_calceolata.AAC.3
MVQNQQPFSPLTAYVPNPVRKVQNWKEWAYTDGSCHIHLGKQVIGSGVYHPDNERPRCFQPNGTGITNTIVRADLAATAAAILQGHIATDSLSSLHQIRKQTLYPELHRQHIQGHILKMLIQLVRNSPTPVFLYKVGCYAGVAGTECAGAIAKHQAIQGDDTPADTTFPRLNLEGNPSHDTTWLAFEEAARTHASKSERPNLPELKLKHFSNLHDALTWRTHMHSQHRLENANTETGYYSYFQSLLPTVHKKVSSVFWTIPTLPLKMKQMF